MGDQEDERKFVLKARFKAKGCTCNTTDHGFAPLAFALWDGPVPLVHRSAACRKTVLSELKKILSFV